MRVHLMSVCSLWALLLALNLPPGHSVHLAEGTQPQQPQPHEATRAVVQHPTRSSATRWNRQSTPAHNCEYKELMVNLHDRVGVLASLDEDQRNRLEGIDKKLDHLEASNAGRLDSIDVQQRDFLKRLDSMEHLQRLTKRELEEWKGETDEMRKGLLNKEIMLSRTARQAPVSDAGHQDGLNDSQKLDALATLLTSTSGEIHQLKVNLLQNQVKLMQATSILQKRLNNFLRRQQGAIGQAYLPPQKDLITNCAQGAPITDGLLRVQISATTAPFYVYCDETVNGGGWTVILNRYTGDLNFQRDWLEYKTGFGNLAGEFFIGLDKLHALTNAAVYELLIAMEDFQGEQRQARYALFAIGNEAESYALKVLGDYEGTAGDALSYHAGSKFSTFDNDNDGCPDCNCAQAHLGAWWYNWCEQSNLMGRYYSAEFNNTPAYTGMYWHNFHGPEYSLKKVRMMIRPVSSEDERR